MSAVRYPKHHNKHWLDPVTLKPYMIWALLTALLLLPQAPAGAFDRAQEKTLSAALKHSVKAGQVTELEIENDVFLTLQTNSTIPQSKGGIVLIHGLGEHPDWPELISPLRRTLPKYGWNTLSIQLPILTDRELSKSHLTRLFKASHKRIHRAIQHFNQSGIYNVLLIGHSLGATIGLSFLNSDTGRETGVTAFVAVSMHNRGQIAEEFNPVKQIAQLEIPVLDLYGSMDVSDVLNTIQARKTTAVKNARDKYQAMKIIGADHFFTGLEQTLIKRIQSWINRYAPSTEINLRANKKRVLRPIR